MARVPQSYALRKMVVIDVPIRPKSKMSTILKKFLEQERDQLDGRIDQESMMISPSHGSSIEMVKQERLACL